MLGLKLNCPFLRAQHNICQMSWHITQEKEFFLALSTLLFSHNQLIGHQHPANVSLKATNFISRNLKRYLLSHIHTHIQRSWFFFHSFYFSNRPWNYFLRLFLNFLSCQIPITQSHSCQIFCNLSSLFIYFLIYECEIASLIPSHQPETFSTALLMLCPVMQWTTCLIKVYTTKMGSKVTLTKKSQHQEELQDRLDPIKPSHRKWNSFPRQLSFFSFRKIGHRYSKVH